MIKLMSLVNSEKNWPSSLLVLLLMLSAQSFSLAHELTHVPSGDNSILCEVCSTGHGLDTGVAVAHFVPFSQRTHDLQVLEPRAGILQAIITPYIARAPPLKDVF